MSNAADVTGILIISHGSPRAEANQGFEAMVARVASRLQGAEIAPAFFSIARPDIPDQVVALASRGVRRILLMPYFLYSGQHVTVDIPALLDECRRQCPQVALELLPTLENDPSLEDLLVERLTPYTDSSPRLPQRGSGHRAAQPRDHRPATRRLGPGRCRGAADRSPRGPRHGRYLLRPHVADSSAGRPARTRGTGRGQTDHLRRARCSRRA